MDLNAKVVVITGASKGLGKQAALHLSNLGARVILVARSADLLQNVTKEIKETTGKEALAISCDISDETDVKNIVTIIQDKFQRVDVLINNAGIGIYKPIERLSNIEMRRHFEVNFYGPYYCTKALLSLLKQSKSGYILNIGSLFSKVSLGENSVYAATKHALAGFSQGLSQELKRYKIKVGIFMPGAMKTSFQDDREDGAIQMPEILMLKLDKAASIIGKMIKKKKKQVIMYRWMLVGLKLKSYFS
ncbi:MAG: SDR family NAD(P)-dependent oxidoreductase [Bacteroidota bacterium]